MPWSGSRRESVRARRLLAAASALAAGAAGVGLAVLLGWVFGVRALTEVVRGQVAMVPNTAVCLVLAGLALWLRTRAVGPLSIGANAAAAAVGIVAALSLVEIASGRDLGIDELLFRDPLGLTGFPPGRMAVLTALSLLSLAAALLTLGRGRLRSDLFGLVPGVLALASLAAYAEGLSGLSGFGDSKGMAVHTAAGLLLLSAGVLLAHSGGLSRLLSSDTAGGAMARRLLPIALLAPLAVNALRRWGLAHGFFGVPIGHALDELTDSAILAAIVLAAAAALMRADEKRVLSEDTLRTTEEKYRFLFESSPLPTWVVDRATLRYLAVNDAAVEHYGYTREEFLSMDIAQIRPPEDAAPVRRAVPKEGAGLERMGVWRHLKKDGTPIQVEIVTHTLTFEGRSAWLVAAYDVSERVRAEQELRKLSRAVEQSPASVVITDTSGNIEYVNPKFSRVTGYAESEVRGMNPRILKSGELPPESYRDLWDTITAGREWHGEFHNVKKDGDLFWEFASISPILDEHGAITHYVAVKEDITERKLAEGRIRQLNRLLRTISEVNQLIVRAQDRDVLLSEACRILVEHGGFPLVWIGAADPESGRVVPRARAGVRPDLVRGLDDSAEGQGPARTALWTGTSVVVADPAVAAFPLVTRVASRRVLVVHGSEANAIGAEETGLLDELAGDLGFAIDALENRDERRKAEEALAAREHHFRSLIENAQDIITIVDVPDTIAFQSPATRAILGRAPEEFVGRSILEFLHPEDVGVVREGLSRALANPETPRKAVYRFRHADGSWRTVEGIGKRLPGPGPPRVVVNSRDVTESRALEQQLLQAQKMEAVGRLAGGVAHDFNNLLTAILGYADLMEERVSGDEDLSANLREIRTAGQRAAALTRQLLAFSRKQILQPRTLDLNTVVTSIEKMLRRLIGEDIEIVTRLAPSVGSVRADPGQIEQVLVNLAVNSRDAMPRGGTLAIETSDVTLDAGFAAARPGAAPGPHAVLTVRDTGVGMTDDVKAHAFEPFFTTKTKGEGTGLGLATVYGIVKQSGGYVSVESEPGRGTTFRIYLPRVEEPAEPPGEEPASQPPRGHETILLVEDEEAVRRLSRSVLVARGYTVLEAVSGEEALEAARAHPGRIHLLLTDLVMPKVGGRELATRLAATRPETKALFVSGYTDEAIAQHGALEPGIAFLQKPFTPLALARKVREVLDAPAQG